jgi:hypothetical protein
VLLLRARRQLLPLRLQPQQHSMCPDPVVPHHKRRLAVSLGLGWWQ